VKVARRRVCKQRIHSHQTTLHATVKRWTALDLALKTNVLTKSIILVLLAVFSGEAASSDDLAQAPGTTRLDASSS
jgi:hypothetical protein